MKNMQTPSEETQRVSCRTSAGAAGLARKSWLPPPIDGAAVGADVTVRDEDVRINNRFDNIMT